MGSLLLFTQMYAPEVGAAANRMNRLSKFAAVAGYAVDVVSWFPHYPQRRIYDGYQGWFHCENIDDVAVRRFRPVVPKPTLIRRTLAEGWLAAGATLLGLLGRRPDVVYATTPSPLLSIAGLVVSTVRRSRFVLEVRDLTWRYPSAITGRELNWVERMLERVMLWVAHHADLVVTTTAEQAEFFTKHGLPEEKLAVVPNGVSRDDLKEEVPWPENSRRPFTVMYAGLVGLPQGLQVLVDAANILREHPIEFVVVGDGLEKPKLQQLCADKGLTNVQFCDAVPKKRLTKYYERADVLFAHLRGADAFATALPSKLLEYMATARPVVFGGRGVAAELITRARSGIAVPPENPEALADAILRLYEAPDQGREYGSRGRQYVTQNYCSDDLLTYLFTRIKQL
ncbi:MAG TPA: glycosyltransferase family 4 protein [Symbiobacteriaceae bacterium]|nr:glycosyltransferase family 4 protein [Symbiobacteriaceae bacterium]